MYPEYDHCRLCPRQCGVNRNHGETGICGEQAAPRLAVATPHHGEEPFFSGIRGSGTLFLAGCPCHCIHCQNWQISGEHPGEIATDEMLYHAARQLIAQGVHNLNWVTPDHHWPHLRALIRRLRLEGETLPVILNTSGYHRPESISDYAAHADIFLPDFKTADSSLANLILSAPDYPQLAMQSLQKMVEHKGFLSPFDPSGKEMAREGVLVRHLVLPGHVDSTIQTLNRLREQFGRHLPIALMSQYQPIPATQSMPPFNRPLHPEEYRQAVDHLLHLDFQNVLIQSDFGDNAFLPDFTASAPFPPSPAFG